MIIENSSIVAQNRIGAIILMILQVLMVVFYGVFIRYEEVYPNQEDLEITIGLCMLILIGFGLILSYLKEGGLSGIGFTLLITTIVFQLFFLINAFWTRAGIQQSNQRFGDSDYHHTGLIMGQNTIDTPVNVYPFTKLTYEPKSSGDFTAWAALKCSLAMVVAFAAVIGRAGILQISIMIPIGTIVYELNSQIMSRYAYDFGSSMRVFLFGGLFGFVCSWAMRNSFNTVHPTYIKYSSSKLNSLLALLGSIFCFVLFPLLSQQRTFVDIQLPIYNYMKFACTMNVVLSMTASVIVSTVVSLMFELKIGMKDFIFSSIAGGIVIGSVSNMITNPAAALIVGGIAGVAQVLWNRFIDRHVNELSIIDSLDALGLFAFSGFQGGLWTAIFSAIQASDSTKSFFFANQPNSPNNFSPLSRSGGQQIGALFMTAGIAIVAGGITGWILHFINKTSIGEQFADSTYWKVEDDGICFQDIHSLNLSSYYSNHTGNSMQGVVINIAPPEVVLPMVGGIPPPLPPTHAPMVSPIIRPGGSITGPCSYL